MADRGLTSTQRFWLEHVEACEAAGVSMKAYAERHGLSLQSFYCWKGQLKKRGQLSPRPSSTDANAIMPVALVASPEPRPGARISLATGITIEVPSCVSPEALVRLIGAAMDVPCAPQDGSLS
jgi:transposase-like protein